MDALPILKALADQTRLNMTRALAKKDMYVEEMAEEMRLTPATVSFHIKKLLIAGLVTARRERTRMMYSLNKDALRVTLDNMVLPAQNAARDQRAAEDAFRRKVIKTFMPCGYCETMPAQEKKRLVIYGEIIRQFEPGATYPETEINERISRMHADYCTVRRDFIGLGWMTRERTTYTVTWKPED